MIEYNYGIFQNQETQEAYHIRTLHDFKNSFNKIKLYAKEKAIIFSLLFLSLLVLSIIIFASISISKSKNTIKEIPRSDEKDIRVLDDVCAK